MLRESIFFSRFPFLDSILVIHISEQNTCQWSSVLKNPFLPSIESVFLEVSCLLLSSDVSVSALPVLFTWW